MTVVTGRRAALAPRPRERLERLDPSPEGFVDRYDQAAITLLLTLEEAGRPLPVPGDVLVALDGYRIGRGDLPLVCRPFAPGALLPLLGAGPFGLALDAGPLPFLGELVGHGLFGLGLGCSHALLVAARAGPDRGYALRAG